MIRTGDVVAFMRADDAWVVDKVRTLTIVTETLEPYARNREVPVAVLTEHSWHPLEGLRTGTWLVLWASPKDAEYADPPWTIHGVVFNTAQEAEAHADMLNAAGHQARWCRPPDAVALATAAGQGRWMTENDARTNLNRAMRRLN